MLLRQLFSESSSQCLALQALEPASILPFDESTMKGALATSGCWPATAGSDTPRRPSIMPRPCRCHDVGAILHLLPGHADRFFEFAFLHQPGELRRTRDIGPPPIMMKTPAAG